MDLPEYFHMLRKNAGKVLLIALSTGLLAYGLSFAIIPAYEAESEVVLIENVVRNDGIHVNLERGSSTSPLAFVPSMTVSKLVQMINLTANVPKQPVLVEASELNGSSIICIKSTARSARVATATANHWAKWTVDYARQQLNSACAETRQGIMSQLKVTEGLIKDAMASLARAKAAGDASAVDRTTMELDEVRAAYSELQNGLFAVDYAKAMTPFQVKIVRLATVSTTSVHHRRVDAAAAGALLGLFGAISWITISEYRRKAH